MKLSVVMLTYNHERFIEQALASVVSQRLNFDDYEIIVADDSSTDRTREIVLDFDRRYPTKIIPLLRDRNLGMMLNFKETLAACQGQYVALLEGDDYWTCEDKLQRQIDFLDQHTDHSICCHRAQLVDETGRGQSRIFPIRTSGTYSIADIFDENWIVTCSVVYRWGVIRSLPDWFLPLKMGDWPLHILVGTSGKINLMNEVMSVYRIHGAGVWSSLARADQLREIAKMLTAVGKHLGTPHVESMRPTLASVHFELALLARAGNNRMETKRHLMDCLRYGGWWPPRHRRTVASLLAYSLFG